MSQDGRKHGHPSGPDGRGKRVTWSVSNASSATLPGFPASAEKAHRESPTGFWRPTAPSCSPSPKTWDQSANTLSDAASAAITPRPLSAPFVIPWGATAVLCALWNSPKTSSTIETTGEVPRPLPRTARRPLSAGRGRPEELKLGHLHSRIRSHGVREVIVATNPTLEGDSTALYIVRMLTQDGVKVTRIASGLPVGGDMGIRRQTLSRPRPPRPQNLAD